MARALDVAAAIVEADPTIDHMKLHKLLFLAQGWSAAWTGSTLFGEDLEAWKYGPMVDDVWQVYKQGPAGERRGDDPIGEPQGGDSSRLSDDERRVLRAVLDQYSKYTGTALSKMSHKNPAWTEARDGLAPTDRGRRRISIDTLTHALRSGVTEWVPVAPPENVRKAINGDLGALVQAMSQRP